MNLIKDFEVNCKKYGSEIILNYLENTINTEVKEKFKEFRANTSKFTERDSNAFSE